MGNAFQFNQGQEGIANLVFDLPGEKVNKLSLPVLLELEQILDLVAQKNDIKALVITSGKEDTFIAGADLHSFAGLFDDPQKAKEVIETGHRVFNKISKLPFPTIAVIHGTCVGGGLEFALACTYRLATDHPKTMIGLPEVSLGLIPGWGGTQRAPRLLGLIEGLNLILSAKPLKAQKAYKVHLVDALAAWEFKDEKAKEFVRNILTPQGKKQVMDRRKPRGLKHWLLEANPLGRAFVYYKAKKDVLNRTKGQYPSPLLALDVVKESYTLPLDQGLKVEQNAILKSINNGSDIARNLIGLFFVSEALKKDPGVNGEVKPEVIERTGVLGAGVMGSGIAWLFSNYDYPVRMKDVDYQALGKGFGAISGVYDKRVKEKKLKKGEAAIKFQHVSGTTDYSGFQNANLVVEAAVENIDLKNKILQELEAKIPSETIIGSNTSSLSITEMAKALKHPERFVGMHFFNPVPRMPLVEISAGAKTSPQTVATAVDFCKKIGKTPIVVGDCPGFLVNRIFAISANELMNLFVEGVSKEKLDKVMLDFGFPMGPFALADEVGIDVMHKVNGSFVTAYGERMKGASLIDDMYDKKFYGKKVGKGFYIYDGKSQRFNDEVFKLLPPKKDYADQLSEVEISDRVMLSMINEASRCLEEKIVEKPEYLDMALIMGTGFPPFRGGLLVYADQLGINYIVDHLKAFEKKYGSRFAPSQYLLNMQANQQKFYPNKN
jgi:3-hydroxyacyl-CoA dehydrogenase / enoyl-CoA hydratase / 3-hydroxybutyryl-CoA epimerase